MLTRLNSVKSFVQNEKVHHCNSCQNLQFCEAHGFITTVHYDDAPQYSRNRFIKQHYRPPQLNVWLCLKSALTWNNETVNIWSHVLGLAYFTFCQCYDNAVLLPSMGAVWTDHVILTLTLAGFQTCMLMSVTYHVFMCLSESVFQRCLCLDLTGITLGILAVYLSGIYYAYFCDKLWHDLYLSLFFVLCIGALSIPLQRDSNLTRGRYCRGHLGVHHVVYIGIILYGVIPTIHWVVLNGGFHSDMVKRFVPNVVVVYAIMGVAFAVYACAVPERWRPGTFDLVGGSHQWWHLLVLLAMVWWRQAGLDLMQFRLTHGCP